MSSFTSSFISTADLGSWEYYIFSDNAAIWRALNGLAAWFNGSGQMLQGAALLGSLIILSMFLWGAATKASKVNSATLGIWFFFMTMLGMHGQAKIHNIYTGQVTVVDNVPALALVPASVFSKAAFKVFTGMETAFQGTSGTYMQVSQFGFIGPLDVLLSLRGPALSGQMAAFNQTVSQVFRDCASDPNGTGAVPALHTSLDMAKWITDYGRKTGITRIYQETDPNMNGTVVPCAVGPGDPPVMIGSTPYTGAADYINTRLEAFANGSSELLKGVNADTSFRNPQDANGKWGIASVGNSYDMLIGTAIGVNQTAIQFTKNALIASTVTYTMDCLSQSGAMTTADTCVAGSLAMSDSMEKWKTQAAMAGSGFLRTMFTSMGVLQALFFALFPVIAVYALVVPHQTAKIFGGFVFFGIWCQSWMLTVAPIQSYIQNSIVDEMAKLLSGAGGMTLANSATVYERLSTKLAVAGDIMASSQMLSLALLSGSMYALSGLAKKWSGERYMDPSKLQHDAFKPSPLASFRDVNSVGSIASPSGALTSFNRNVGQNSTTLTSGVITNSNRGTSLENTQSREAARKREESFTAGLQSTYGISQQQAAGITKSLSSMEELRGSVGAGVARAFTGGLSDMFRTKLGRDLTPKQKTDLENTVSTAQSSAVQQLAAKDSGFIDRLMGNAGSEAQAEAVGKMIDVTADVVSTGAIAVELASGVGAPAALVTRAAVVTAATAGKNAVMQRIRAKGAEVAKSAAETAAIAAAARRPGGIGDFADALSKGISADFITGLAEQHRKETSDSIQKDMSIKQDFKASDADALAKSWRSNIAEGRSESHSNGQTQMTAMVMDREGIMGLGTRGSGGVSGEEFRRRAESDRLNITTMGEPTRVAAAKRLTQVAMAGVSPQSYGGGALGEALHRFEENLTFANFYKSSVGNSVMNTDHGVQVGGQVPLVTTAAVAAKDGYWQKTPDRKAAPNQQAVDNHFLSNWKNVPPTNPQAQAAAKKAGWRFVQPQPGHAATNTLAEYPTQTAPVALSAAGSAGSPMTSVPTGGLGKVGISAAGNTFIASANAKNQAAFDSSNSATDELTRLASGAVKSFEAERENNAENVGMIATGAVLANGVAGLGGNGAPLPGRGTHQTNPQQPPNTNTGTGKGEDPDNPPNKPEEKKGSSGKKRGRR